MLAGQVNQVPLALAFGAGLVASVNPCGFALLPSLLSYYLGSDTAGKRGVLRVADGLTFGIAYAVGSLSCTLPVFLLVVTAGLAAGSVGGTLTVFVAYAIGMAAILMLPCLGTASLRELVIR